MKAGWSKAQLGVMVKLGLLPPCRSVEDDDEVSGWAVQLCLWSLNPAVAFRSVSEAARSVILASGTLSPLGSFASEVRCRPMTMDCEGFECLWVVLRCNMQSDC